MFPLHVRSYSASFATAGNWSWNFLLTFFTPFITSAIHFRYGYVFAGCNLLAVIVVFFFYYESAGLNLEQVDSMYCDPAVKPWQSASWVPKGHTSRYDAVEAAKEDQVRGAGIRAEAHNLENVDHSARSSTATQIPEIEKEPERMPEYKVPETDRGRF
jgi:MFS transporter, SP family, sugar:H+ symporter